MIHGQIGLPDADEQIAHPFFGCGLYRRVFGQDVQTVCDHATQALGGRRLNIVWKSGLERGEISSFPGHDLDDTEKVLKDEHGMKRARSDLFLTGHMTRFITNHDAVLWECFVSAQSTGALCTFRQKTFAIDGNRSDDTTDMLRF